MTHKKGPCFFRFVVELGPPTCCSSVLQRCWPRAPAEFRLVGAALWMIHLLATTSYDGRVFFVRDGSRGLHRGEAIPPRAYGSTQRWPRRCPATLLSNTCGQESSPPRADWGESSDLCIITPPCWADQLIKTRKGSILRFVLARESTRP